MNEKELRSTLTERENRVLDYLDKRIEEMYACAENDHLYDMYIARAEALEGTRATCFADVLEIRQAAKLAKSSP